MLDVVSCEGAEPRDKDRKKQARVDFSASWLSMPEGVPKKTGAIAASALKPQCRTKQKAHTDTNNYYSAPTPFPLSPAAGNHFLRGYDRLRRGVSLLDFQESVEVLLQNTRTGG